MNKYVLRGRIIAATMAFIALVCVAGERRSNDGNHLSLNLTGEASAADVGLPAYPGAKPYTDAEHSSSAANVGIATSLFGFKVVAVHLETPHEPNRVAAFYRRALSKYGEVLECDGSTAGKRNIEQRTEDDDALACDPDDADEHSVVYKVGTEKHQRIVAIKPHASGARFSLVHVNIRGESKR